MNHVHIPSIAWEEGRSPGGKFGSHGQNISVALGGIRNVGTWGGGHPFDVQIRRIAPSTAVCPFHLHLAQWELFVVQRGTASVRTAEGNFTVRTGEVFVHPPGSAHQLANPGPEELEVLVVADNPPLDAFFYPDSHKWGLRPPGKFFRMTEVDYFEGEDPAPSDAISFKPVPATPLPIAAPFAQRRIDPATLPWETWESPQRKFHGESKELSIALGAKRNTPTGLGGHPFDLELSRLQPGRCGCPFHRHAAEWEMFLVLSGTARVRTDNETKLLVAGDVVLHPPGEAHQIANASETDDLLFYVIASNAPVDYWEYPDSGKWGFRAPRKIFRPVDAGYWDGEE